MSQADLSTPPPELELLIPDNWRDYELIDSGEGRKLERYGPYLFDRPEPQAMWAPGHPVQDWQAAHAIFEPDRSESGGNWRFQRSVKETWEMSYGDLRFQAQTTSGRHLGVFPEQAVHWDWATGLIHQANRPVQVLNLFGYTGLATLAAAAAGARVTHVDASKKAVRWARHNQALSGLEERPVRWIIDDALKFVEREIRRGVKYDGIFLDPPKFGRGPKGEVWEFFDHFPRLLQSCMATLSQAPLFVVITAYAIRASSLALHYALLPYTQKIGGVVSSGELALLESSAGRRIPTSIFSRWSPG